MTSARPVARPDRSPRSSPAETILSNLAAVVGTAESTQPRTTGLAQWRPRMRFEQQLRIGPTAVQFSLTTPRRGPNRSRAARLILRLLQQADQTAPGEQTRVYFLILLSSGERLTLGSKGGYTAAAAITGCAAAGDDPLRWLSGQIHGPARAPATAVVVGIDTILWRRTI